MKTEQVAIIGAGPAGIAAAIQLKRWGIEPLLLEKNHVGGLLINANLVENYPGFPEGIPGPDLVSLFEMQMERTGVQAMFEEVIELDYVNHFIIETPSNRYACKSVIIASGTCPKPIREIEIPQDAKDKVFSEVHHLFNKTGKKIAVIGAGDAAFDYAINLVSRNNEVTILNRSNQLKCLPLLWQRTKKTPQITYTENTVVNRISKLQDQAVLHCENNRGDWELTVDYVIFAIGRNPQRGFLSTHLDELYVELESKGILHFVGDVKNDIYRQASIAVGDGVRAAMMICQTIEETW